MTERKKIIRIAGVLFIMLYFSYCYFLQNPDNWNSVPRIALALSIIEDGTPAIDKYRFTTHDIAQYKGRFYSDKAPGMSLMAIPSVALARQFMKSYFRDVGWLDSRGYITIYFILLEQIANIFSTAIFTVFTALTIYFLRSGSEPVSQGPCWALLPTGLPRRHGDGLRRSSATTPRAGVS